VRLLVIYIHVSVPVHTTGRIALFSRVLAVMSSSSFIAKQLNGSTILITEDDAYGEHPYIYVKIHPTVPVLIIGDTGCDKASKHKTHGMRRSIPKVAASLNGYCISISSDMI